MLKLFRIKSFFLIVISIIVGFNKISTAQTMTALINDLAEEIFELNIDPNNYQQITDSLNSNSSRTRWLLIKYCGAKEIYESSDALRQLLINTPFAENPPYQYSITERVEILYSLVELEDSTIKEELKDAIVVMSDDSLNVSELSFFSRYLMQKFNDDFGWQYIKPYYEHGSSQVFGIDVYYLKDFLNSGVRDEVVNVLRNLSLTDYRSENRITAIDYLTEINDSEIVNIIMQASLSDTDKLNRFRARENLKKIDLALYINTLKTALEIENDYRLFIYDGLLRTGQPAVYKYVVDIFKSNQYPADSDLIKEELDNSWLLNPKEENTVSNLLDSLSSSLSQIYNFNWMGDLNFVQELNALVEYCKAYYLSGDTLISASYLKTLSSKIDMSYRDSISNEYVNKFAYDFLYPQTLFIRQRINSKSVLDSLIYLTPTSIQAGGNNFTLSIKGTSFNSQAEVYWDGYPLVVTFISDTIIQAIVPSSNIIAPDDSIMITVFNPIYGISNALNFKVTSIQQTPNLTVNLKNSLGNQIPASNVMYYEESWKDAINNGDGTYTVITTRPTVSIRVFYEYASQQLDNVPAQNNTYTFTTVNAAVQLKNSLGSLIDAGTVQYYAGAWRSFGTTLNGASYKELLPINYSFRMTYEYGSIDKQQNLSTDPTVIFQTVNAAVQLKNSLGNLIDAGTVQYYAGAWRTFGTTSNGVAYKELLPVNYSFRMTYEYVSKDKQQNLSTNPVVDFSTVLCIVKVSKTSDNEPINNATVKYYSGAWRNLGTTNIDGITTKELLPANLSFRATSGTVSLDKQQDISVNNLVEILLNVP